MISITNNTALRIAAVVVGLALVAGIAFSSAITPAHAALTESQIQSILSLLSSFGADSTTISNVEASLRGTTPSTPSTPSSSAACPFTWTRDLRTGATGSDVLALQKFLNSDAATVIASSGAGSPGNETTYFGSLTGAAVAKFQNKYASEILAPVGLTAGTGYFGPSTRAKANSLCTGSTTTTPPPAAGTSLTVSSAVQPANSLAVYNAARVPFTRFTVTAGTDGDVVLNGVVVERTGLAADTNFTGVMLIDQDGNQVGLTRTLNSNHQATIGEAVTIPRGTSRTFTVAANMNTQGSVSAGQVAAFSVVAVNSSGSVIGSLPITGAAHTINATLAIGSVTMARGGFDPGSNQTKEVGTTAYNFSSIRITAGSAEDVYVKSIRWNQTGSAGASDLANVQTVVDGTSYPTTVSADGKFYTTTFPGNGLLIQKGFNKDVTVRGDIVGGSSRTIDFDIAKRTDIYLVGATYGYGITPPLAGSAAAADGAAFNNADDYYYDAAQVTVSAGTITVSAWTGVPAQNIAENLNNQPLGGFSVDVKGEPVTVGSMVFRFYETGSAADFDDIDSVSLVDQNGNVVAGPVDAVTAGDGVTTGKVTFTDSVTFKPGITNLTLRGKVGTDFATNDTIAASTTPSSDWTSVTGQTTGTTITPSPTSALTGNTMTVKAGALTVSVSSVPIAQTVIAGSSQFEFARYIFDATASGEDLRVTSIPLAYGVGAGTATDLTNCKLYDGTTVLTTGSNIKNPTTQSSSTSFTFDGTGLILTRGTSKTIGLKCDLRSGATGAYLWGIDAGQNSSFTGVSGVDSGQTVAETFVDSNGQTMTAASGGSLTAVLDTNSPGYKIVSAGATGVELARIKFSAANEDVNLRQIALQLSGVASNTPVDLVGRQVTLWTTDGTQIGTAVFPTGDNATSSAITNFTVPKDGSKVVIVKGDIATISNSGPLTASGDLLVVDYDGDNNGLNGNYGVGASSGSTVTPSSADTASAGVRIMKAYPVFAKVAVPSNTLTSGADKVLYRFKVTAVGGDVALYKVTINTGSSTVSATTSSHTLYAYTDSGFSTADTTFDSQGKLNEDAPVQNGTSGGVDLNFLFQKTAGTNVTYIIGSGATRYFEYRATVSSVETGTGSESIDVKLLGDAAFPVNSSNLMEVASTVDGDTNDDFIWSPISTTTQNTINDLDFTNGYQVEGLPSPNMTAETFTSTN